MGLRQSVYDFLIDFFPSKEKINSYRSEICNEKSKALAKKCIDIFKKHRVYGANFALFDGENIKFSFSYGYSKQNALVSSATLFRIASISKLFMGSCIMKLFEQKIIDIDENISDLFPSMDSRVEFLSFRKLLTHTSPIKDGDSYNKYIGTGISLSELLKFGDNYKDFSKKTAFEYSNLGYGMAAVALEQKLNMGFEDIMQEHLFKPLSIKASFYPQTLSGDIASAFRVFPRNKISMNINERLNKNFDDIHDIAFEKHYSLSPGNCYTDIYGAKTLANALMHEGFLSKDSLNEMKRIEADFDERDKRLFEGVGIFVVDLLGNNEFFYGHQGLAYNAVHGLYFDDKYNDGMVFLSSGASEKRKGVLADVNIDLIELWRDRALWK